MHIKITIPEDALIDYKHKEIEDALFQLYEHGPSDCSFGICFNLHRLGGGRTAFGGYDVVGEFFGKLTGTCGADPFRDKPSEVTWGVRQQWVAVMQEAYSGAKTITLPKQLVNSLWHPIQEEFMVCVG